MLQIKDFQRPNWQALPYEGCVNVSVKALERFPHLALAMLRFDENAHIHEHDADIEIDVYCLEGEGMVSVNGEEAEFKAGQKLRWPAGLTHQLWTKGSTMTTLMVEHLKS